MPNTNSKQVFRNVLDDGSHSVFQGSVTCGRVAKDGFEPMNLTATVRRCSSIQQAGTQILLTT